MRIFFLLDRKWDIQKVECLGIPRSIRGAKRNRNHSFYPRIVPLSTLSNLHLHHSFMSIAEACHIPLKSRLFQDDVSMIISDSTLTDKEMMAEVMATNH